MLAVVGRGAEAKARAAGAIVLERVQRRGLRAGRFAGRVPRARGRRAGAAPSGRAVFEVDPARHGPRPEPRGRRAVLPRVRPARDVGPLGHRRLRDRPALAPARRSATGPRWSRARWSSARVEVRPAPNGRCQERARSIHRVSTACPNRHRPARRPGACPERRQGEPGQHRGRRRRRELLCLAAGAFDRDGRGRVLPAAGSRRGQAVRAARILAFNFVIEHALGGGASRSLRLDSQGKALRAALLEMRLPADAGIRTEEVAMSDRTSCQRRIDGRSPC